MKNLKDNIDHYMRLKGIKKYSHLLVDIAHELGIRGQEAYKFASREKSNYSKMLKGERPLKHEFIIPLEKIFGVSLARLTDEDAYKLPVEKANVPFNKGFRYYAYLDDAELYRNEFDLLLTRDGKSILTRLDEFGKSFLDYVVEYGSTNAVRYLHEEYGIKLKWGNYHFELAKASDLIWIDFDNCIDFARLVASMDDAELFYDIFDSFSMFFSNGHYGGDSSFFCNEEYLEIILDSDSLFDDLFELKLYIFTAISNRVKREKNIESIEYTSINPIINNCLRHALRHPDKYRQRAKDILEFGIKYNAELIAEAGADEYYICDSLGVLRKSAPHCSEVTKMAIFVDCELEDPEINALIDRLPKFRKYAPYQF